MCALKTCLWVAGIACLLSVVGIFLPTSALESIFGAFGVELVLSDSPPFEYMVRLMSATYAAVGIYFIILALDPMKYGILVPFTAVAAVVLGLACMITGVAVKMPPLWFLSDSVPCVVLGLIILVFWKRAEKTSQP